MMGAKEGDERETHELESLSLLESKSELHGKPARVPTTDSDLPPSESSDSTATSSWVGPGAKRVPQSKSTLNTRPSSSSSVLSGGASSTTASSATTVGAAHRPMSSGLMSLSMNDLRGRIHEIVEMELSNPSTPVTWDRRVEAVDSLRRFIEVMVNKVIMDINERPTVLSILDEERVWEIILIWCGDGHFKVVLAALQLPEILLKTFPETLILTNTASGAGQARIGYI